MRTTWSCLLVTVLCAIAGILLVYPTPGYAQNIPAHIDSLQRVAVTSQSPCEQSKAYYRVCSYFVNRNNVLAETYADSSILSAKNCDDQLQLAKAYKCAGVVQTATSNYPAAIDFLFSGYEIMLKEDDPSSLFDVCNSIANAYMGDDNYENAAKFFKRAREYALASGDTNFIAVSWFGLANSHSFNGEQQEQIDCLVEAAKLFKIVGRPEAESACYDRISSVYYELENQTQSDLYFNKAMKVAQQTDEKYRLGILYRSAAGRAYDQQRYREAIAWIDSSNHLLEDIDSKTNLVVNYDLAATYYLESGNATQAYAQLRKLLTVKDSLNARSKQQLMEEASAKYALLEKERTISAQNQTIEDQNEGILQRDLALEYERDLKIVLYSGAFLLVVFAGVVFQRFRIARKQNVIIAAQRLEVENQKQEILDSINYAKRIQTAILPNQSSLQNYLGDSLVIYQPKDIVAGDFYWLSPIDKATPDKGVLFAVADCTGHGVPGAMVSVVCNNGLNRSVREFGINEPGKILDKTRELVIAEFEKSEEEVRDGMDIALCALQGNTLRYAGAHNPLWIIRNGSNIVEEIKANKQPIGQYEYHSVFTTHEVELCPGDTFYIFSDGFADQFGGPKGKKYKSTNFKKLLVSMQQEPMKRQQELIQEAFSAWKGDLEQIDDVCVIGVRL